MTLEERIKALEERAAALEVKAQAPQLLVNLRQVDQDELGKIVIHAVNKLTIDAGKQVLAI